MITDRIRDIANAVIYEGYILYPYRPSAIKNRQRWTFGSIFPRACGDRHGDACAMQTQVLLRGVHATRLDVRVRFLQIMVRDVGELVGASVSSAGEPEVRLVSRLVIDGTEHLAWEEAIEREITVRDLSLDELRQEPRTVPFQFDATRTFEVLRDRDGSAAGALVRTVQGIDGTVTFSAEDLAPELFRTTVRIENLTPLTTAEIADRGKAQRRALASAHTILEVRDGAFISSLDPPGDVRDAVAACRNQGTFPVLVGEDGATDTVLSSPIFLYDYPKVARQSAGDLFDATEIDEILTLRILTMTDAEKREMASADVRARALLERTHALTRAELAGLHGVMRTSDGSCVPSGAVAVEPGAGARLASLLRVPGEVTVGAQVRLRPRGRGDIMDIVLKDKIAVVEAIERDFEDRVHVAVTLCDDPGQDLGSSGFPGHRFYFAQDEIELLDPRGPS